MVTRKPTRITRENKRRGKRIGHPASVHPRVSRGRASDAEAATKAAWGAVKKAVRSSKAQPVTAARATGDAVTNVARSGARQTTIAAEAIARAAEEVLMSAMGEARTAAKAAREAAREVERSVGAALKAIRIAVRRRALVAVNQATRERHRRAVKKIAPKRRQAPAG
jgi:hypothetical protein